jgi:peptidoglycan/LPS O-acetylase OafA/YrhL
MSVQDHPAHGERPQQGTSTKSKAGLVLIGFLIIAGALLFTEHRAHVLGLLVWLPLLGCLLMHLFMHHSGHGHHQAGRQPSDERRE